jgi:hemerythrin-like domain-containing protein
MSVLDTLKKEHLLVRRYLDNIEVALDLMHKGGEVPEQFFNLAVDFSRNFMDKYHHFKEEYVIFLKLAEKKAGELDPQIVSLRDQHERGRSLVKSILRSVPGYIKKDEIATAKLEENLGFFHYLQKQHLNRENHIFYPMVRKTFSDEEMAEFEAEFDKDAERYPIDMFKKSEQTINEIAEVLKAKFGAQYRDKLEEVFNARKHDE